VVNKNFNLLLLVIIMLIFLTVVLLSVGYTIALFQKSSGNDRWLKGKSLPTPRTEVMAVSLDDLVYVIGGFTNEGRITNTVEVYNTTNNFWYTALIPLPIPLHHASASTHDGRIYVVGGHKGDWNPSNRLFIYDPKIDNWTTEPSMPTARGSTVSYFVGDILFVIGGDMYDHSFFSVEAFDTFNGTWTSLSPMPTTRHGLGVVNVDNTIYVIVGGLHPGLIVTGRNEVYLVD